MKTPKKTHKWELDKEEGIYRLYNWDCTTNAWKQQRMMVLPSPPPHKGYCIYTPRYAANGGAIGGGGIVVAGLPLARAKKMARAIN